MKNVRLLVCLLFALRVGVASASSPTPSTIRSPTIRPSGYACAPRRCLVLSGRIPQRVHVVSPVSRRSAICAFPAALSSTLAGRRGTLSDAAASDLSGWISRSRRHRMGLSRGATTAFYSTGELRSFYLVANQAIQGSALPRRILEHAHTILSAARNVSSFTGRQAGILQSSRRDFADSRRAAFPAAPRALAGRPSRRKPLNRLFAPVELRADSPATRPGGHLVASRGHQSFCLRDLPRVYWSRPSPITSYPAGKAFSWKPLPMLWSLSSSVSSPFSFSLPFLRPRTRSAPIPPAWSSASANSIVSRSPGSTSWCRGAKPCSSIFRSARPTSASKPNPATTSSSLFPSRSSTRCCPKRSSRPTTS